MSNSRKTVWIIFAIYTFILLLVAYMVDRNQNNLDFLLRMKNYIPFMLYFAIFGVVIFLFALLFHQMDNMKAKKLITQLENDKNHLKAKLFDMQEEKEKTVTTKSVTAIPAEEPKNEETPPTTEEEKKSESSTGE